jgi:tetratricopeptide (TPR) repeat protein
MVRRGSALFSWLCVGVVAVAVAGCGGAKSSKSGGATFANVVAKIKKDPDASVRAMKLTKLAVKRQELGFNREAEQAVGMAADECKQIEDVMMRAESWGSVAIAQAKLGNKAGARIAMKSAREAAQEIKEKEMKAGILIKLAKAQGEMKDTEGVTETLKDVEKLAGELKDGDGKEDLSARTVILNQAAVAYQKGGIAAESERLLKANFDLAKSITDLKGQADSVADVAMTQNELGKKDEAGKTLDMALDTAKKIEAAYGKSLAMASIGDKYAKLGNVAKAREVFKEAEQATMKIPDQDISTETLQKIREMSDKLPKAKK